MKSMRLSILAGALIRRPWLPAALVGVAMLTGTLSLGLLLGNQCAAGTKFLPELSDEAIVCLWKVHRGMSYVAMSAGIVLLTCPVVTLCLRQIRATVLLLLWGAGVYLVGPAVKSVVLWSAESVVGEMKLASYRFVVPVALNEQIRTAKYNLEKKAEAATSGRPWERSPIPRFDTYRWTFGDDRYAICKRSGQASEYELVDEHWRPSQCCKGAWDGRCLLTGIVRWHEDGDRIFVTTKDGKRYYIVYGTGDLKEVQ